MHNDDHEKAVVVVGAGVLSIGVGVMFCFGIYFCTKGYLTLKIYFNQRDLPKYEVEDPNI